MYLQNYKKNYIITLVDASENKIENSICMEGFAHHQFLLVDKDGYAISQETVETPFSTGDVIYVAAGRRFGMRCEGSMRIRHIAFTGRSLRPLLHYCRFGEFCITASPSEKSDINIMFDKIFALQDSAADDRHMELSASLYTLLAKLGEINIEKISDITDSKKLILRPVTDFMQQNYRTPSIPYESLASSLGMTITELNTLFADVFSTSAADFYKQLRMENAKHLLFFYAALGAEYVAANMGYTNISEFEADFYTQFNITPEKFIRLYWDNQI